MSEEYLGTLDSSSPKGTNQRSQLGTYIRTVKQAKINTFPNLAGAVTSDQDELNYLDGALQHLSDLQLLSATTSATRWVVTSNSNLSAYVDGQRFCVQPDQASLTQQGLNIDSVGVAFLAWPNGEYIQEGEIPANAIFEVVYDAGSLNFVVIKI